MNNHDLKLFIFNLSIVILHISYLAVFLGIWYIDESYIRVFSTIVQLVVCIFLIVRFFPFSKIHEITKLDASIIFYCATFLLLNVVVVELYNIIPIKYKI
jgi:hypothetical protein